ncbi:hypothetical protein WMY93_026004 [Mugilogobius chulae]|uniref:Prolactin receptor n=1 Tax=Mugilogobius chulae TaxID=88201 RepID=A0AAW0N764_9GOBI
MWQGAGRGKDGTTPLRWPTSSLKFTKFAPHISYSSNLRDHEKQEDQDELLSSISAPNQTGLVHEQTQEGSKSPHIDSKTQEHLLLKDKTSTATDEWTEKQNTENCPMPTYHSHDYKTDNFDCSTQNLQVGRLEVATENAYHIPEL